MHENAKHENSRHDTVSRVFVWRFCTTISAGHTGARHENTTSVVILAFSCCVSGGCNAVRIVKRHRFASHLKRISVVVRTEEQFYAFVKGAPETIQERLNDIPAFYVSEARNLDRDVVEIGLIFAGFAVFNCPIRGDSFAVLLELKQSSHDLNLKILLVLRALKLKPPAFVKKKGPT
nr:probable manganese-transporting ATPase PDR2 [Tanacetum cinerariifolium]